MGQQGFEVKPGLMMAMGCKHKSGTTACGACFARAVTAARTREDALNAVAKILESDNPDKVTLAYDAVTKGLKGPKV